MKYEGKEEGKRREGNDNEEDGIKERKIKKQQGKERWRE